jgi:molybdopterin-synthase adenylyltransferase
VNRNGAIDAASAKASADRYSRQTLFFQGGRDDQERLGAARVALVGCGALGTVMAGLLVRAGVGFVRIIDRDFIEISNLQRQTLFDEEDIRLQLPKAVAAARKLALTNADVTVEAQAVDFHPDNAERLLGDADLVMDGSDNFEARYLINDVCVRLKKPWIYSAAVGSYGVTMSIRPGQTPCFRCVFPEAPPPGVAATCDTTGVIGPISGVIGSLASAEAMKLLTGANDQLRVGLLWVDVWYNSFQSTTLAGPVADCPTCQQGRYDYLDAAGASRTASLCGRDAVQIRPAQPTTLRIDELGERLKAVGEASWNPYLLRFFVDAFELTVFPDGRALIKGTDDPSVARSLYARYIGA